MKLKDVLRGLEDAKSRKLDWREIGRALTDVDSSGAWRDLYETPTAWLAAVANTTGLSEGFLRRTKSIYRFFADWQADHPETDLLRPDTHLSFLSAETLKRLHDIGPAKADALLAEVGKRRIAHSEVRTAYEKAVSLRRMTRKQGGSHPTGVRRSIDVSASKLGIRQTRAFEEKAFKAVANQLDKLSGGRETGAHYRFYKFEFTAPQAVAVGLVNSGIKFADGFEFRHIISSLPQGLRNRVLGEVALSSTFFRRYWLVLPANSPSAVSIADDLQELDLHSVGIATWSPDAPGELEIIARPRGNPVPDRQEIGRADVLRQGIPS